MQNSFLVQNKNEMSTSGKVTAWKRQYESQNRRNNSLYKKEEKICAICGKYSNFKFYNVQSCDGCKQFFRRIIVRQNEFLCSMDGNCDYMQNKCRGCRLDQCLRVGMEPNCVQAERSEYFVKFVKKMRQRRVALLSKQQFERANIGILNFDIGDQGEHNYLCRLISAQNILWIRVTNVPEAYLGQFETIEDVLEGPGNILSIGDKFAFEPMKAEQMEQFMEEAVKMENLGMHRRVQRSQGVFTLMVVGIFKALPAFIKLTFRDKLILVRELGHTINLFIFAYFSIKINSNVMLTSNGRSIMALFKMKYKNDAKILNLLEKIFAHPMDAFLRIPMLQQEEYALLLAIFCSNSTVTGLSEYGRSLLEAQQSHYSRLFMRHLQAKLGGAQGAIRFAECVQLIESAFQAAHNLELMHTYIEVFHSNKDFYAGIYPECLKALVK